MLNYSNRHISREIADVRDHVDGVGKRMDHYEESLQRLDSCVRKLESIVDKWNAERGPGLSPAPGPRLDSLLPLLLAFAGGSREMQGLLQTLGVRLPQNLNTIMNVAQALRGLSRADLRPDLSKLNIEGVTSLLLLGLVALAMEDKLREGVSSIAEVMRPYRGVVQALIGSIGPAAPGPVGYGAPQPQNEEVFDATPQSSAPARGSGRNGGGGAASSRNGGRSSGRTGGVSASGSGGNGGGNGSGRTNSENESARRPSGDIIRKTSAYRPSSAAMG